jgi:signal transduction histidine kinase
MASCPTVAAAVMRSLVDRVRRFTILLQEREKMAGLGTLAAGLAHELNNPASAATRAVTQAEEIMDTYRDLGRRLVQRTWSEPGLNLVQALDDDGALHAVEMHEEVAALDPVARSDREDALANWLSEHGIDDAWECSPSLVEAGFTPDRLSMLAEGVSASELQAALEWAEANARLRQLFGEIRQSTGRISELVAAVKGYSHADRVTPKNADVHMALENTLTMLGYKMRAANITVHREYDRTLPKIKTFGAELHQVWTNLIDNAIDAIQTDTSKPKPSGTITVKTSRSGNCAQVDVIDDGPGIPSEALPRLFEAFFTTKEVGKGTGLGLEIVRRIVTRHDGTVTVSPEPGATTFTVRLPLADEAKK